MTRGGACAFEGCGGTIEDGYCAICGRAPLKARPRVRAPIAPPPAPAPPPPVPPVPPASTQVPLVAPMPANPTRSRFAAAPLVPQYGPTPAVAPPAAPPQVSVELPDTVRMPRRPVPRPAVGLAAGSGQGLVDLPSVAVAPDPAEAVVTVAEVPEDQRFCPKCQKPIGRSRGHRPGRTEGFCPYCRNHFSFVPRLAEGELVAERYEVVGVLAYRMSGWVHLARDRSSGDRWVALNGVLDAPTAQAAVTAAADRQFLLELDHATLVAVHEILAHEGAVYVVTEYVAGKSLKAILDERRVAHGGEVDPLPLDVAMACVLGVLPALGYLHQQCVAFGDLRPDSVVLNGNSLRAVDLSGVRQVDDDPSPTGPFASDLYVLGWTLATLALGVDGRSGAHLDRLPPVTGAPVLAGHESFHRFLLKATAVEPADRFRSAEDLAEQLLGVLREQVAAGSAGRPAISGVFGPDGLATATDEREDVPVADWRTLPRPKVAPEDPGAGFLFGLVEADAAAVTEAITSALMTRTVAASTETLLRLARAQLESGLPEHAASTLDGLTDGGGWRLWWHRGLLALAIGKPSDAVDWLDPVYTELPGEVAPKLALGLAHEMAGDLARSAALYDRATRTDPSYVSGAFGLARVRLAQGDREGAVEALRRVPAASSCHADAEIAAMQALAAPGDGAAGPPTADQLSRASAILEHLELSSRRRLMLTVELYEAGLATVRQLGASGADLNGDAGLILDQPLEERALRRGIEAAYRQLARHASTARERVELIDKANRVRPRTLV